MSNLGKIRLFRILLGLLSSAGLVIVGIVYAAVVGTGIAQAGLTEPILDPVLAAMEAITLIAGLLVVALLTAIYGYADHDRKPLALISLSLGVIMEL